MRGRVLAAVYDDPARRVRGRDGVVNEEPARWVRGRGRLLAGAPEEDFGFAAEDALRRSEESCRSEWWW